MHTAASTSSGTPGGFPAAVSSAEHGNLVDPAAFRAVMGEVCTAVTVVTAMDGSRPHGTTVSAFSSLSLDPPLVLVSLDRGSQLLEVITAAGRFGVNVLSRDQAALAARFATRGPAKFDGVAWRGDSASPRLEGV